MVAAGVAAAGVLYTAAAERSCARGQGCHVKLGVLYTGVQALFSRVKTGLRG